MQDHNVSAVLELRALGFFARCALPLQTLRPTARIRGCSCECHVLIIARLKVDLTSTNKQRRVVLSRHSVYSIAMTYADSIYSKVDA